MTYGLGRRVRPRGRRPRGGAEEEGGEKAWVVNVVEKVVSFCRALRLREMFEHYTYAARGVLI